MVVRLLALGVLAVGCGGGARAYTVTLVNRSPRAIAEVFVYPMGAADHGSSRARLAPNASAAISVKGGNVDVLAVGAKERIDATQTETKTATQTLELRGPRTLVFHDSNQQPAELRRPETIGVTFRAPVSSVLDVDDAPSVAPAP